MSRTVRRKKFNKKNHFFQHYWECFSHHEVEKNKRIKVWQYHSDNYYTKSCKNSKQFWKNLEYKKLRRHFKNKLAHTHDYEDFFLNQVKAKSINWDLH